MAQLTPLLLAVLWGATAEAKRAAGPPIDIEERLEVSYVASVNL